MKRCQKLLGVPFGRKVQGHDLHVNLGYFIFLSEGID